MTNERDAMIEAAEESLRMENINSTQWRILSEKMADFAIEQIEKQALHFNDAIPAMKEAYRQGCKDTDAKVREVIAVREKEIATELNKIIDRDYGSKTNYEELEQYINNLGNSRRRACRNR